MEVKMQEQKLEKFSPCVQVLWRLSGISPPVIPVYQQPSPGNYDSAQEGYTTTLCICKFRICLHYQYNVVKLLIRFVEQIVVQRKLMGSTRGQWIWRQEHEFHDSFRHLGYICYLLWQKNAHISQVFASSTYSMSRLANQFVSTLLVWVTESSLFILMFSQVFAPQSSALFVCTYPPR